MKKFWLNKIEIALLLSLCLSLCAGAWAESESEELAAGLVRLHVLAVSDEEAEQEIKLRVRDSVLLYLTPKLEDAGCAQEALVIIEDGMDGIKSAAEEAAGGRRVTVTLDREYYPTREYGGFSLPAGTYTSLRVVLGEGKGHNWWCVVFPPLCLTAAEAADVMESLPDGDAALITGDNGGYVLKFRLLELWGELKSMLCD
ncbi:MAG: stage II sporulation protein R [Clostridia bacterium]|nr:stage II sporulation protein R [Clostridia bacterium]